MHVSTGTGASVGFMEHSGELQLAPSLGRDPFVAGSLKVVVLGALAEPEIPPVCCLPVPCLANHLGLFHFLKPMHPPHALQLTYLPELLPAFLINVWGKIFQIYCHPGIWKFCNLVQHFL